MILKIMKNNKNWCFFKLLHGIHNSTGHGVHNIIIYNIFSHNYQFLFCFLDITYFLKLWDNIVDKYDAHTTTTRNMKSVQ